MGWGSYIANDNVVLILVILVLYRAFLNGEFSLNNVRRNAGK